MPFSGIIRIRDMMYSVADPFRLDQGDVSFDAPDCGQGGDGARDRRQPDPLPADHRHAAPARADRRETARQERHPDADAEDVLVTNGGIHGLYILFRALLEPGDEVLIPDPAWPPAAGNILAAQGVPVGCPLHESSGWRYDLDEVESKITPGHACSTSTRRQPDRRRADAADIERHRGDRAPTTSG